MHLTLYSIVDNLCVISRTILFILVGIGIIEITLISYIETAIYQSLNEDNHKNIKRYIPRVLKRRVQVNTGKRSIKIKIYFLEREINY